MQAASSDVKLQILPLECQFNIVNDGSNTVQYITPVECGQPILSPTDPDYEPPLLQGDQSQVGVRSFRVSANSIQDTSTTVIDTGTVIIGLPQKKPIPRADNPVQNPPYDPAPLLLASTLLAALLYFAHGWSITIKFAHSIRHLVSRLSEPLTASIVMVYGIFYLR